MTNQERHQMLKSKVAFVESINEALNKTVAESKLPIPEVERVDYVVHLHSNGQWIDERVVITYRGGAIGVRNCSGTSCVGIFTEIAKLLDGGYYDEVERFKDILSSPDWVMADYCSFKEV